MNIVAIQCRTNTGELMEVPVREFFSMSGELSITPTGTVPKSNGKEYIASGISVDPNGVVTFKSYTKPGIVDGTASGIIAHDANGRLITIPITLQGQTQKQNVTQSSIGTSTENILPVYSDGNGTLSDSTILKDGENYSVGGAAAFFKWDVSLGSVNINQGTSVENGYRLNGKLVVSYDPVTEELTIGNATYTTTNIQHAKVESAIWTTALGGTITDVAEDTLGDYILIKPAENGTYATREWVGDNGWLLEGNTLPGDSSVIGSLNNTEFYVVQNGNPKITIGNALLFNASSTFEDDVEFQGKVILGSGTNRWVGTNQDLDWNIVRDDLTIATIKSSGIDLIGNLNISGLTASQLIATDASKNLVSLSTATYPSLTELSYVKGVTSAIQPQLNSKESEISAGTTSQYWRGDKSWQTLNTTAVVEGANLYFTNARAIASVLTGYTSGAGTVAATDTVLQAIQKLNGNIGAITLSSLGGINFSTVNSGYTVGTNTALTNSQTLNAQLGNLQAQVNGKFATPTGLTTNYVTKWNGTDLANSLLFDNGTNVGIGTNVPDIGSTGNRVLTISGVYTRARLQLQNTDGVSVGSVAGTVQFIGGAVSIADITATSITTVNSGFLSFSTNNSGSYSEKMRILPNGNVGIGTTSPSEKLDVSGTIKGSYLIASNLTTNYVPKHTASGLANSQIFDNGNIGIGTASPVQIFQIRKDSSTSVSSTSITSSSLSGYVLSNLSISDGMGASMAFQLGGTGTAWAAICGIRTSANNSALSFYTEYDDVFSEKIRISPNGNFGLGINSPSYKLDVSGTGHFTGAVTFDTVPSSLQDATSSNHLVRYSQFIAATYLKPYNQDVKTVSFTSLTKSGLYAINGYTPTTGQYVLDAANDVDSGVWVVSSGSWSRATDADTDPELRGFVISISQGTYAGYKYYNTNNSAISMGSTAITYNVWSNISELDPVFTAWRDITRSANTFWAAPNGSNGVATWRGLVAADVPTLNQNTTGSAATLTTARNISASGDLTWTVAFNGSADVTAAATLATVNSNIGTFTSVTVNAKGLVTAASSPTTISGYGITDYNSLWDTRIATKSTTDLTEGSNLYYTNARGIGSVLTGYVSGAGVVAATDTTLQAIQKLDGNIGNIYTKTESDGRYLQLSDNNEIYGVNTFLNTTEFENDINILTSRLKLNATSGANLQVIASNGTVDAWTTLTASHIPSLDASKITSGTFADARIASAATWNAKQAALVSGTNIKTVGSNSLLGSGDVPLSALNYWAKTGSNLSYTGGYAKVDELQVNAFKIQSTGLTTNSWYITNDNTSGNLLLSIGDINDEFGTAFNLNFNSTSGLSTLELNADVTISRLKDSYGSFGTNKQVYSSITDGIGKWETLTTSHISDLSSYTGFDTNYYTKTLSDERFVHLEGDEFIDGNKSLSGSTTFTGPVTIENSASNEFILKNINIRAGSGLSNSIATAGQILTRHSSANRLIWSDILSSYITDVNAANKLLKLNSSGLIDSAYLPAYIDDVLEYDSTSLFPSLGETGKIYVDISTNKQYRWSGSTYVQITDGKATWGGIDGTLSAQTDLQSVLNLKANLTANTFTGQQYFTTTTRFSGSYGLRISGDNTYNGKTSIVTNLLFGDQSVGAYTPAFFRASDFMFHKGKVKIGGTSYLDGSVNWATESLDIDGNVRYSGTLKPNNTAPSIGQFLKADSTTTNTWSAISTNDISGIDDYLTIDQFVDKVPLDLGELQPYKILGNATPSNAAVQELGATDVIKVISQGSITIGSVLTMGNDGVGHWMNLDVAPQGLSYRKIAVGDSKHYLSELNNFEFIDNYLSISGISNYDKKINIGVNNNDSFINSIGGKLILNGANGLNLSNFSGTGTRYLTINEYGDVSTSAASGGGSIVSIPANRLAFGASDNSVTSSELLKYFTGTKSLVMYDGYGQDSNVYFHNPDSNIFEIRTNGTTSGFSIISPTLDVTSNAISLGVLGLGATTIALGTQTTDLVLNDSTYNFTNTLSDGELAIVKKIGGKVYIHKVQVDGSGFLKII